MSKHNIPFFEVNGKTYEIKRNRFLQAEFDNMRQNIQLSEEEEIAYVKEEEFNQRAEKLRIRKDELYEKYLETFDEADEIMYQKALSAFNSLVEEASKTQSVIGKYTKSMLDMGEKLIIKSLQINSKGEIIRTEEEANNIWNSFVDENGQAVAIQFVTYTINYIIGGDEEIDNPFIAQAKAKAEQQANMKKGIGKAK